MTALCSSVVAILKGCLNHIPMAAWFRRLCGYVACDAFGVPIEWHRTVRSAPTTHEAIEAVPAGKDWQCS